MEALNLPLAIWFSILTLLPAKSVVIVRSVSKFFLDTIDDDEIGDFYRHKHFANRCENRIFTLLPINKEDSRRPTELDFRTRCQVLKHESVAKENVGLEWYEWTSSYFDARKWTVAASLDGVLVITSRYNVMLWNPSIRKARRIPRPAYYCDSLTKLGLGYDDSCKDYKILAIRDHLLASTYEKKEEESNASVYSVENRIWATVELPTRHKRKMSQSVAIKGRLVWIEGVDMGSSYYHRLVRFDFSTEMYRYSPTPYPIRQNLWVTSRFVIVDGGTSLGVWGLDEDLIVTLWITDSNATVFSWMKMCNLGEGVQQMRGFANKELVFEYWTKSARLKPSVYVDDDKYISSGFVYVDVYVESLVLVKQLGGFKCSNLD